MRHSSLKSRPSSQPDPATRQLVLDRADGGMGPRCELCQDVLHEFGPLRYALHHRRGRTGTPDHSPSNLLVVCGQSNVDGCHGIIHSSRTRAQVNGWMLSRHVYIDPSAAPVLLHRESRWVYLTADGRYSDSPDGE